eukprot:7591727-Pyramimonas_sp.AAC.1
MESETDPQLQVSIFGALSGVVQTVARGELYIFWVALWVMEQYVAYVTDNQMVHEGWWPLKYRHPTGEHAELWAKI